MAADLETRKSRLEAQSAAFEAKNTELADQAAGLASQIVENNNRAAELDARSAQLDANAAQLQDQAAELAARSAQLDASAAQLQDQAAELAARSAQLDAQTADLGKYSADLQNKSAELQSQSDTLQSRAADLDSNHLELKSKLAELQSLRNQLDADRNHWDESRAAREQNLASREETVQRKTAQLESQQALLHAEKEDWQRHLARRQHELELREDELAQREPDKALSSSPGTPHTENLLPPQSDRSPPDSGDALQRPNHEIAEPCEMEASAADETESPSYSQHDAAHEEESVNDYMVRLMQRIRSTQSDPDLGPTNTSPTTPKRRDEPPLPLEITPAPQPEPAPATDQRREPAELLPHTVAPEKHADITLLRNLAIYSAQNALGTHSRRQTIHSMYSKLAVALIGGLTGIGLLVVWNLWFTNSLTFFSAMMSFVVAVIWGVQYVLLTVQLLVSGSSNIDSISASHSKKEEEKTPAPRNPNSTVAAQDLPTYPESPPEDIKSVQSSHASDASDNYRFFKNM